MGDLPGYGQLTPSDLQMGLDYNRWFISHACYMFEGPSFLVLPRWSPAFRGLQVALGFESAGWWGDNEATAIQFWEHWCAEENMGIWPSWYYAVSDNWYGDKSSRSVGCMHAYGEYMLPWNSFAESTNNAATHGSGVLYRSSLEY